MFSKNKEQPTTPLAPAPQPAPLAAKRVPRTGVPSIISADLIVQGTLFSSGDVQIDGKVEGDIRAGALVIGDKAVIHGDIYADEAVIRGRVEGGIRARKVQLCSTCHVEGNILHEALAVEAGAFFEGNCRHSDNPLADAPESTMGERRIAAAPAPVQHQQMPHHAPIIAQRVAPQPISTPIKAEPLARAAASFAPLKA